jgi:hypothetical protein
MPCCTQLGRHHQYHIWSERNIFPRQRHELNTQKDHGKEPSHGSKTMLCLQIRLHQQTEAEKRLQQMVLDLGAKYDALSRTMDQKCDGKESLVDNLFQSRDSIFTDEVSNFDLPGRFKVPDIFIFSGSEDLVEHLDNFRAHMSLHKTPDAVAC